MFMPVFTGVVPSPWTRPRLSPGHSVRPRLISQLDLKGSSRFPDNIVQGKLRAISCQARPSPSPPRALAFEERGKERCTFRLGIFLIVSEIGSEMGIWTLNEYSRGFLLFWTPTCSYEMWVRWMPCLSIM